MLGESFLFLQSQLQCLPVRIALATERSIRLIVHLVIYVEQVLGLLRGLTLAESAVVDMQQLMLLEVFHPEFNYVRLSLFKFKYLLTTLLLFF